MKHPVPQPRSRNRRAFVACLLSYFLLASQMTPLVFAAHGNDTVSATQSKSVAQRGGGILGARPAPTPRAVPTPIITATKVDAYPSHPSGKANPGDVITYTVTVANTGTADATGVTFNDSVDTNTTLVPGSVNTQPIATDDAYNVIGNVRIQPSAATGLLANDRDPDTGNSTGLTASGPSTTTQGGNITINGDGSFIYNPPAGFAGTDTVTYTITDAGGKTDTAVATFTVGNGTATPGTNVVWFVNPSAAAGGDGRLTTPFNCYTGASTSCFSQTAPDDPGDSIFLYSGAHTGGYALLANQKLVGQAATDTLANIGGFTVPAYSDALPATGGTSPTITTTVAATNAVPVSAGGIVLRGFTVGNTTGAKIFGNNFGTLTAGNTFSPDVVLNGTGQALNLTNGSFSAASGFNGVTTTSAPGAAGISLATIAGTVTFGAANVSNSGAQGISISGSTMTATFSSTTVSSPTTQGILVGTTSGTINFSNTTVTGGTDGVSFQNNTGANTRTFGTLGVSGGSGVAFLSGAGGGNVTVNGAATLSSAGDVINIANSTNGSTVNFAGGATVSKGTSLGNAINWSGTNTGATLTFSTLNVTANDNVGMKLSGGGTVNVTTAAGSSLSAGCTICNSINRPIDANGVALGLNFTTITAIARSDGFNTSSPGITLNNVTGSLTVNNGGSTATNIQSTGGAGINVTSSSATLNFGNTNVNSTGGTGVILGGSGTGNSGAITFGALTITPDSGQRGIFAQQNTGAITSASGTVTTTNNTAVEFVGTSTASKTPLNIQLTTVNTTGGATAPNGIRLVNTSATASPGGFRVLGTGGTCNATTPTCTGGRITNTTGADSGSAAPSGAGVSLDNAATVVLNSMRIDTNTNYGIRGSVVSAFTLSNSLVATNGDNQATPFNDSSIYFNDLSGTSSINTSEVSGGYQRNIFIDNTIGTLDLTVTSCNIHNTSNAQGDDGLAIEIGTDTGASNATVHVTNNTFSAHGGDHFDFTTLGTPTVSVVFTGNNGNPGSPVHPIGLGQGFRIGAGAFNGTLTYDMSNNTVYGTKQGNAITVNKGSGTGTFSGRVSGNTIGQTGVTLSGASQSDGINVESRGGGSHTTLVTGNTIRQYREYGINVEGAEAGTTTMNATVTGNTVDEPGSPGAAGLTLYGIQINWGIDVGNTSTLCADIGGSTAALKNNIPNSGNEAAGYVDLRSRQRQSTTVRLPGYTGANNDNAAVNAYFTARNTLTSVSATNTVPTGGGYTNTSGGAQCTQPTIPTSPVTIDGGDDTVGGAGGVGTVTGTAADGGGVTSRPFISPRPVAPTIDAPRTVVARPTTPTTVARNTPTTDTTTTPSRPLPKHDPVIINGAGGTVSVSIGTLAQGDSITITFQVVVDNPYSGGPNVSNQGTVSGTNFSNVLTDDPAIAGAANPTLTPIASLNIKAQDGRAPEPVSGTTPLLFTVTLDNAPTSSVTVNYATANGGATPATGGAACDNNTIDYVTTNGTVNFAAGERIKTISVNICADATVEPDETFLLNLSGAVGGTITRAQAVGTITAANPAGTFLISELRTSGPGGLGDDFVELYNNTNSPLTVAASDASAGYGVFKMGTDCNATPVLIATIPNGTVIPARGHYLLVGSQYSLGGYATGNLTLTSDIESDRDVAVFSTADVANLSTTTRLDAAGFDGNTGGGVCDLLREGTNLPAVSGSTTQYSFFRKECDFVAAVGCTVAGTPKDTNDNSADFKFADTQGTFISGVTQQLGAPGPENLASPIRRDATIATLLLDGTKASTVAPNRVRDLTSNPGNNSTFGTLSIRRRFTNNTGAAVTRLRFRIVEMTTFPSPGGGQADLRAITSANVSVSNITDPATCLAANGVATTPCTVTVKGTTLEQPPTQPNGGGFNSSMAEGTVTVGTPLANGASTSVQFLLGVQTTGTFRFYIIVEALP